MTNGKNRKDGEENTHILKNNFKLFPPVCESIIPSPMGCLHNSKNLFILTSSRKKNQSDMGIAYHLSTIFLLTSYFLLSPFTPKSDSWVLHRHLPHHKMLSCFTTQDHKDGRNILRNPAFLIYHRDSLPTSILFMPCYNTIYIFFVLTYYTKHIKYTICCIVYLVYLQLIKKRVYNRGIVYTYTIHIQCLFSIYFYRISEV